MLRVSNPPADKRLTICHTGQGPNRNTHARPATPIASNASTTTLPAVEETGFHGDWITWDLGLGCC